MTDLQNKVALITGSARGIGKAIALRYASLGARIVVNYASNEAAAQQTVDEIRALGSEAVAVQGDVGDLDALEKVFQEAIRTFGKIDIVVANAGVEIASLLIADVTEKEFDRFFSINTKGTFFTLQKAAKYVEDHGRIICIGSSTTSLAFPTVGLYGSSKMAPRYTVEVLAQEIADRGVTVNSITPTAIEGAGIYTTLADDDPVREIAEANRIGRRMGRVEDVADAAEYFASDLARWVSGQNLLISGGARQ